MEITKREDRLPLNMQCLIILASFLILPTLVANLRLQKEYEILCSFVGYILGPYLALAPLSYKARFMIGCASGIVPIFLGFNTYLRAFVLGLINSYFALVIEMFCGALCVRTKKARAAIVANIFAGWLSFLTFFSLHFCPVLVELLCNSVTSFVLACTGTLASYYFIVETPEEIFARYRLAEKKSRAYEEMYSSLSYINGPDIVDEDELKEEYRIFLDEKSNLQDHYTIKEKAAAALSYINVSFIYISFQWAAGVENRYSLYRLFLGAMQLFTWTFRYYSRANAMYVFVLPPAALYFMCVSTNNTQDVFLVFLMLLGANFLPKKSSGHVLQRADIAFAKSLQYVLVFFVFFGIASTI
ncbi:uncharacterized protein NEMAJ01_0338 [Nematocida major]|uniref:uncharacterized protein n=1 Tax=Nematocida major TaxID=1912982 RepID=UPI00200834FA|nr:uncharacterized protein NEMAJ01_0338 [Nematocida major]KAH9385442.1 hypothetical protein NEMAJ01_0338 [Nematocida major]